MIDEAGRILARGAPTEGFVELSAAVVGARREARALAETFGTSRLLGASEAAKAIAGRLVLHRRRQAVEGERRLQELSEGPEAESILVELPDPCLGGAEGCWDLIAGIWQRGSLLMSALARSTGATYLHVLQPNQYVEGSKPFPDEGDVARVAEARVHVEPGVVRRERPHELRAVGRRLEEPEVRDPVAV